MSVCYIIGAGDCNEDICPKPGDLVIAADGGGDHLSRMGLCPDLLVGDLDSLQGCLPACPILRYPKEKDDTDMALAIEEGVRRGYREFFLFGMLGGGRLDHTLSACLLLPDYAARGLSVRLFGGGQIISALAGGQEMHFTPDRQGYISLFALGGPVGGLVAEGVKYPLSSATLLPGTSLGVSNEFLPGRAAHISLAQGHLLVVWQQEWKGEEA